MVRFPLGTLSRNVLAALLAACAMAQAPAGAAELSFALRIDHGQVPENMRTIRVEQGDVVRLQWSTDSPVVLHLHGYDIEARVEPGAVKVLAFTAYATGRFPVEVHAARQRSDGHAVEESPLVYVEVYPR